MCKSIVAQCGVAQLCTVRGSRGCNHTHRSMVALVALTAALLWCNLASAQVFKGAVLYQHCLHVARPFCSSGCEVSQRAGPPRPLAYASNLAFYIQVSSLKQEVLSVCALFILCFARLLTGYLK